MSSAPPPASPVPTPAPDDPTRPAHDRVLVTPRRVTAAVVALATGAFAIGTTEFVTLGLLPEIAVDVGVSTPSAGHLVSAYAVGVIVGAPLIATTSARLPRKGLLIALVAVVVAGNLLTAVVPTYGALVTARFLAGLPHGAFFGVASLVAASLVPPERRGRAISRVMLGIPVATLVGVPLGTLLGQQVGWRSTYVGVALLAALSLLLVALALPRTPADRAASGRTELRALARPQVWFSLVIGAVGFAGMFAMYSYIAFTVTDLAGRGEGWVPVVLLVFGVGATLGTLASGPLADVSVERSVVGGLAVLTVGLAAFGLLADRLWALMVLGVVVQVAGSVVVIGLQLRLMADAGTARNLGAALNHASINAANALGAWIGGLVLTLGLGLRAPSLAGAVLAAVGLVLALAAVRASARTDQPR